MDTQKRGLFVKSKKPITPPYFSSLFNCIDCHAPCILACDRNLLSYNGDMVEFKVLNLGCNFCEECAKACMQTKRGVLDLKFSSQIQASAVININSCLAWNDTICFNCLDSCKFKAIEFLGVFRPMVSQKCVGCGECLSACFKNSITLNAI
ncbi:4Fe-4S ferredoxin [Campylobacter geochelonis]|uniref:4Fe-4S ferredoxin n=1 Tax=Campylobacter geochelonis TaxID=1780362 RepID=UPI000770A654|nr:4Fe-4S ferredoxin [Campylobacter geochelonis]CZE51179.1 4Fe-4S ferredoxin iron-sulfur binding domain-containing protein [Campylobacter geochelonis]